VWDEWVREGFSDGGGADGGEEGSESASVTLGKLLRLAKPL